MSLKIFSTNWLNSLMGKPEVTTSISGAVSSQTKTQFQTKILNSSVNSGSVITALTFNNLTIGDSYRISGHGHVNGQTGSGGHHTHFRATNGSQVMTLVSGGPSSTVNNRFGSGINTIFTATATTLTFQGVNLSNSPTQIVGDNTMAYTYITLERLPNHEETTGWT